MIEHHQGAVTMAHTEIADGQNPDAKKLAEMIITAQQTGDRPDEQSGERQGVTP